LFDSPVLTIPQTQRLLAVSYPSAQRSIANNVESLSFSLDATAQRVLDIYAMSVTVVGKEGRETYRSQFASHIAFRNDQAAQW
jgi:hypothetical protein